MPSSKLTNKYFDSTLGTTSTLRNWKTVLRVALAERLGVRRILTIDGDFSAVRMGRRWSEAFDLAVPLR